MSWSRKKIRRKKTEAKPPKTKKARTNLFFWGKNGWEDGTLVQNKVILRHEILHFPTSLEVSEVRERASSERSGARKRSEQAGASERVSGASERANGLASGPVLTS